MLSSTAPTTVEALVAAHSMHIEIPDVVLQYFPAPHCVHVFAYPEPEVKTVVNPYPHFVHAVAPAAEISPLSHHQQPIKYSRLLDEAAYFPAAQSVHAPVPTASLYFPAAHAAHGVPVYPAAHVASAPGAAPPPAATRKTTASTARARGQHSVRPMARAALIYRRRRGPRSGAFLLHKNARFSKFYRFNWKRRRVDETLLLYLRPLYHE